jgi:hypothetical protein
VIAVDKRSFIDYMFNPKPLPSQDRLKELFDYDTQTGCLSWKSPTSVRVKAGDSVKKNKLSGYYMANVDGNRYRAHRLIWMWYYGIDPGNKQVDHIDHDRGNNRINNLRLVTHQENHWNENPKGYTWSKKYQKYVAQIFVDGHGIFLGHYTTKDEARNAYLAAKSVHHIIGPV